jgi:hypothetical protein
MYAPIVPACALSNNDVPNGCEKFTVDRSGPVKFNTNG